MPQTYRVTLSDGRAFDVTTEGGAPSEADVLGSLPQSDTPQPKPVGRDDRSGITKAADAVVDVGIGAAKGVGNTVFGLGKIARDYTPIGRISDAILPGAFDNRPAEITPTNTAQKIGFGAEQIGEFFTPTGAIGKIGKVAEIAKSGGLTLAQSGDKTSAGISAGLSAALPHATKLKALADRFRGAAEKTTAQALGATKEWAKAESAKIAPEMLKRGVRGTREAMLERAKGEAKTIGQAMDDVIADAAARGTIVDGVVARQSIQAAKRTLITTTLSGQAIPIEGAGAAIKQLDKLDKFVERLGPAIPIEHAQRVKQVWDKIVSKSGLYGPKATASATDNARAWAIREAAGSFRKLIADASPDLAALNKEFAFWGGLRNVLKETEKRTQAQGGGLVAGVMGTSGVAAGLASGDSVGDKLEKALVYGAGGRQFVKLMQSPWWRTTVSAPAKQRFADALATGKAETIGEAVKKIMVALPAQARLGLAQ